MYLGKIVKREVIRNSFKKRVKLFIILNVLYMLIYKKILWGKCYIVFRWRYWGIEVIGI